jgi:hypothetical protein
MRLVSSRFKQHSTRSLDTKTNPSAFPPSFIHIFDGYARIFSSVNGALLWHTLYQPMHQPNHPLLDVEMDNAYQKFSKFQSFTTPNASWKTRQNRIFQCWRYGEKCVIFRLRHRHVCKFQVSYRNHRRGGLSYLSFHDEQRHREWTEIDNMLYTSNLRILTSKVVPGEIF